MAQTRRFTEQLVIITDEPMATRIRAMAEVYRISEAQVMRDMLAAGSDAVRRRYARDAGADPAVAAAELVTAESRVRARRRLPRAR